MTGNPPNPSGADPNPAPPANHLGDEELAVVAARQALTVPGVLRLQPGRKHAVGRAARLLFSSGGQDDQLAAAASGIEVSRGDVRSAAPVAGGDADSGSGARERSIEVTVRVITAAHPSPRGIAREVQRVVSDELALLTRTPVTVVVVIVDVEDDE